MKIKTGLLSLLLTALAASACGPAGPADGPPGSAPGAWFDAPRPGSTLPLGPVQLVSHFSDPGGIAEIELTVNGETMGTYPVDSPEPLVTDSRTWTPVEPGRYTLWMRARSKSGSWSEYAQTFVVIPGGPQLPAAAGIVQGVVYADQNGNGTVDPGEGPLEGVDVQLGNCGAAQSQTTAADGKFVFANLPSGSCTLQVFKGGWGFSGSNPNVGYPIPAASDPNLPTALSVSMAPMSDALPQEQAGFGDKGLSTDSVSMGRCDPPQVTFEVAAQHPAGIKVMVLFFRLEDVESGELSAWNEGLGMNPGSSGVFSRTVSGDQLAAAASFSFDQALVHYQFVMQPEQGEYVRSHVYSDLYLSPCGGGGGAPPARVTPTRGPGIVP
jgi:hypothetical protein